MMYIEIYEVFWREATRVSGGAFISQKFQRVFFNHKEAKEFEQKRIESGLNPEYIKLKIHKMPVKRASDYPVGEIA